MYSNERERDTDMYMFTNIENAGIFVPFSFIYVNRTCDIFSCFKRKFIYFLFFTSTTRGLLGSE